MLNNKRKCVIHEITLHSHATKLGLRSTSSNAIIFQCQSKFNNMFYFNLKFVSSLYKQPVIWCLFSCLVTLHMWYWNELSKRLSKKVISKVFTYKLIIDQVNVCRQCIHDFLIVSFDFLIQWTSYLDLWNQLYCGLHLGCLKRFYFKGQLS